MSLDVLSSKQINVNCNSISANYAELDNLFIDNINIATTSDELQITHTIDGGGSEFNIKRHIKEIGPVGTSYLQKSVVKIFHNYGGSLQAQYYSANTTTTTVPPGPDWTFLGSLFNSAAVYTATIDTNIIHNGIEYQCNTTTTANTPFNAAEWTLVGFPSNTAGDLDILTTLISPNQTSIHIGISSKDPSGLLDLISPANNVSVMCSKTGNIVFQPHEPFYLTTPNSAYFSNSAIMNYDHSQNFVITKSRASNLDISGRFIFNSYDAALDVTHEVCSIRERNITGVATPFGELHTELITNCGYTVRNFSATTHTHGSATLTGGTVTVATTACGPNSYVMLSLTAIAGTAGFLRVGSKTQTGFTVSSSSATDASTFDWILFNPNYTP